MNIDTFIYIWTLTNYKMNIITYTKKNLIGKSILGYALLTLGLITLIQNILFGFIFIAIGINLIGYRRFGNRYYQ